MRISDWSSDVCSSDLKMDEAYLKHHFWVRPKLKHLPSEYYKSNCFASFGEHAAALDLVELHGLQNNFMWANDYPHHEGSWPHSAEAIERTFGNGLREETRANLLGLNAARAFRLDVQKEIGRASCRESVCQTESLDGVAVQLKNITLSNTILRAIT